MASLSNSCWKNRKRLNPSTNYGDMAETAKRYVVWNTLLKKSPIFLVLRIIIWYSFNFQVIYIFSENSFRGYPLQGEATKLPDGYTGLVLDTGVRAFAGIIKMSN